MAAHDGPMGYLGVNNPQHGSDADDHLKRMLAAEGEPFLRSCIGNVKEAIHPPKLPSLDVTTKPVAVKDIWGFYGGQKKQAGLSSIGIHVLVVVLLFAIGTNKTVQKVVQQQIQLIAPDLAPYKPTVKKDEMHGGGGGGDRSPTPPSKGKLPKLANKQFVPPAAVIRD